MGLTATAVPRRRQDPTEEHPPPALRALRTSTPSTRARMPHSESVQSSAGSPEGRPEAQPAKDCVLYRRGGGGWIAAENGGETAGNTENCPEKRQHNQTPRSPKERHLGTGDTQRTHTHVRGTGKREREKHCGKIAKNCRRLRNIAGKLRKSADLNPLCDIPSGRCFFTGPWTVTRSSLRMLRRFAAFCRPLRSVLLLVSFPRSRSPVIGVPGLCWWRRDVPFARQRRPIVGVLRMCWLLPPPPPPYSVENRRAAGVRPAIRHSLGVTPIETRCRTTHRPVASITQRCPRTSAG